MLRAAIGVLILAALLPAYGKTYKDVYPLACSEVWGAVKQTLGDAEHYNVKEMDDAAMRADYQPKHSVHVNVTGTLLQRMNHVRLLAKGSTCEIQVVSNFSGWEHNDREDFKKRVDAALAGKAAGAPEAAKPEPPGK